MMRFNVDSGAPAAAGLFAVFAGLGIVANLVFFWALFCGVVMIMKPVVGACESNWPVDSVVVFERAFCPTTDTHAE